MTKQNFNELKELLVNKSVVELVKSQNDEDKILVTNYYWYDDNKIEETKKIFDITPLGLTEFLKEIIWIVTAFNNKEFYVVEGVDYEDNEKADIIDRFANFIYRIQIDTDNEYFTEEEKKKIKEILSECFNKILKVIEN